MVSLQTCFYLPSKSSAARFALAFETFARMQVETFRMSGNLPRPIGDDVPNDLSEASWVFVEMTGDQSTLQMQIPAVVALAQAMGGGLTCPLLGMIASIASAVDDDPNAPSIYKINADTFSRAVEHADIKDTVFDLLQREGLILVPVGAGYCDSRRTEETLFTLVKDPEVPGPMPASIALRIKVADAFRAMNVDLPEKIYMKVSRFKPSDLELDPTKGEPLREVLNGVGESDFLSEVRI